MTVPDLTGNTALDVAIGLAFVYLLFSILCSAVQEAIAGIFDMRAATLEKGLANLLEDDGGKSGGAPADSNTPAPAPPDEEAADGAADNGADTNNPEPGAAGAGGGTKAPSYDPGNGNLTDQVLGHGLVRTLYKRSVVLWNRKRRGPSYIPSRTFALALLNTVAPATTGSDPFTAVRKAISEADLPNGTKSALLALADEARNDRDRFRRSVEQWFDSAMDRVSGWYKRKTQIVICVLSLLVAVGLNVNTVAIADRLTRDDSVRAAVVQAATNNKATTDGNLKTAAKNVSDLEKLGVPIGWNKEKGDPARPDPFGKHWSRTIFGWLLTFLALSLGAPFWFDALGKLAGLRNTGAKPKDTTAGGGAGG
jgi:hypothetical protein